VSHATDLRTAIAYLADLEAELEERSTLDTLGAHSAAREDMLYQLDHARQLVANLESRASTVTSMSCRNGCEVPIDLQQLRAWCRTVEARIARICSGATAAAAA
jgi:hypothetical protein